MADRDKSRNAFESEKPGTNARTLDEGAIEDVRRVGGVFVLAVRATRMAMAVTDPTLPGNPIVFANQSFLKLSGYSMDEVLGQQPHFMNGRDTDPNDAARFAEALRNDQDDVIETVQYRKDQSRFVATVLISAFKDERGETVNHFLSWLDVTRRADAEQEVTDLKSTQALLRESEERQAFLLELSDALRAADGADEIEQAAVELLGHKLGASRVFYATIDDGGDTWSMKHDYSEAGPSGGGQFPMSDYQRRRLSAWQEGKVTRVTDSEADPDLNDDDRVAYAAFGARAAIGIPLVKGGRFAALMVINQASPRIWTEGEVTLAREAAERTWNEIERARAEANLRRSQERLRNVLEGMDEGFGFMDRNLRIITQNKAALEMDGRSIDELQGRKHSEVYPNVDPAVTALYERALADGKPVSIEHRYGWDEGRASWLEMRAYPVPDGLAVFWRDISERKAAQEKLEASEERYRKLFESMDEAYAVVDVLKNDAGEWADFRFVEVNPAFLLHTNMPPPVGKTATELLGTPNPRWTELYGQALDTGQALRVEEGEPTLGLTFDLNIFTLDRDKNRVAVLFTNITERKRGDEALRESERHANLLLAELQHRVRNTLGVVRSIARRTADNSGSPDEMLAHFQGRLDAFSRVQAALTRSPDAVVDLASLIEDEMVAHAARDGKQVSIEGPEVPLNPKAAERLSLAIHELTTNAVKHGAFVTPKGRVRIRWSMDVLPSGDVLTLDWTESGVTIDPLEIRQSGFGMELLQRSLPYDLQAETSVEFRPHGLHFTLRVPLPSGRSGG